MLKAVTGAASVDDLESYAEQHNCSMLYAAAKLSSPLIKNIDLWPAPKPLESYRVERQSPSLVESKRGDLLTEVAKAVGKQYQFPPSTAFLHGLGVVAAAATRNFRINYYGDLAPVNLFCVTSQPPSTGKSGVNGFFTEPLSKAYDSINKKNKIDRRVLMAKIEMLEKDIAKTSPMDQSYIPKIQELEELQEKLDRTPIWKPFIQNATPEAMEERASAQCGMVNLISAEAEAATVMLGDVYKDANGGKGNFSMLLSMWDNERADSERISRKGVEGKVRGSIAVIAQDPAIDAILRAGQQGRGIAERFLLLAEPELLGKRDHTKFYPVPDELKRKYVSLITNIATEDRVIILRPDEEGIKTIAEWRNSFESKLARGGEYESNLIRGFMGKADKQVLKIAATLHIIDQWQDGADKSIKINEDYIWWAISLFTDLSKTYINAADALGYTGDTSEVIALADKMIMWSEKGRNRMSIGKVVDNIKRNKPFNGIDGLTSKIKRHTLPELEKLGYCVVVDGDVFINPRLK